MTKGRVLETVLKRGQKNLMLNEPEKGGPGDHSVAKILCERHIQNTYQASDFSGDNVKSLKTAGCTCQQKVTVILTVRTLQGFVPTASVAPASLPIFFVLLFSFCTNKAR